MGQACSEPRLHTDKGDNKVLLSETDYDLYVTFYLHNVSNGTETRVLALFGTRTPHLIPPHPIPPPQSPPIPHPPQRTPTEGGGHPTFRQPPRPRACPQPPRPSPRVAPDGSRDLSPVLMSSGRVPELSSSFQKRFLKICKNYGLGPENIINLSNQGGARRLQRGAPGDPAQLGPGMEQRGLGQRVETPLRPR